ncbi:MAG: hypothetical protein QM483_09020 [Desulfuromusa sp.]
MVVKVTSILLVILLSCFAGECFAEQSNQFVDPMRPVRYQAPVGKNSVAEKKQRTDTKEWKLTAVLISAGRSVAVINGKSLQEGEQLGGYKLIQIDTDKVILNNKQEKLVLRRAGTGLKKISTKSDIRKGSKP